MESEKIFYSIISAIIIIGGISIGAAYYGSVSSVPQKTTAAPANSSLTLVITPSGWYANGTASTDQPAYLMVGPNGTLQSTANIKLPSHTLITLRLVDYDDWGLEPNIGSTGTSNNSAYSKVVGTVGGVEYVYNSTNINTTLPTGSTSGINIPNGFAVSQFNWQNGSNGGYDEAHTFTILNGSKVMVNIPTPGQSIVVAQFYLNTTGTFNWQCFVPCGAGASGWEGAMITAGWMTGTVQVS